MTGVSAPTSEYRRGARWLLASLFAGAMLASLCGCGENPQSDAANPSPEAALPATVAKTKGTKGKSAKPPKGKKPWAEEDVRGLRFQLGAYSTGSGMSEASGSTARTLTNGDAAQEAQVNALLELTRPGASKEECLNAIAQLNALESDRVPLVVQQLLGHPDQDVRAMALGVVEGVSHPSIDPVLDAALRDRSVDVRLRALEILSSAPHESAPALLSRAIEDKDANVRAAAFHSGLQTDEAARQRLLDQAARSLHPEIAISAIGVLDASPSKANVPLLIRALSHTNQEVQSVAREALALTFHSDFPDRPSATRWWSANQHRFSPDLEELVMSQP